MSERLLDITQPSKVHFGPGCIGSLHEAVLAAEQKDLYVVVVPELIETLDPVFEKLRGAGIRVILDDTIAGEPTIKMLEKSAWSASESNVDGVIGIGGGSVMDVAKGVAATLGNQQPLSDIFGIGNLSGRKPLLILAPTTSGTGSEVSPNAIFYDESEGLKKAIISPHIVADVVFIDPELTLSAPPGLTAASGMDALTHCIEAYTNINAHPLVDGFARQGIRLISRNLERAVNQGDDLEARIHVAMGSLFGGMCLGPVNTAGVHALAYPLEGMFKIPHGLANSMLLPLVMDFNLESSLERYADVAIDFGIEPDSNIKSMAKQAIKAVEKLSRSCGIPRTLPQLNENSDSIAQLAEKAMTVTRLLKNNPREITYEAACNIYKKLS